MIMTNTGEEPPTSPAVANTLAKAIDARLMVAARHADCRKLKDLLNQEDADTMVVVVASGNKLKASAAEHSSGNIHPMLLAAACEGNCEELNFLLNGRGYHQRGTADVEEGGTMQAPSAVSLLEGVTVKGNTALHVVAANGDMMNMMDFIRCATFICDKDKSFLSKQNHKGDTPLHCAARAGNSQMVSHLIGLARSEDGDDNIVEGLLRKENKSKETVLHDAVRIGDRDLVKELLRKDPELARFPSEGTSPMYLAILLKKENIARILHEESKDKNLSYFGPNGQNALHAAVLRGKVFAAMVLEWKKDLTAGRDENGSTPLHFAAGRDENGSIPHHFAALLPWLSLEGLLWQSARRSVCSRLLEANRAAQYQPDHQELYPIHVAASVGAKRKIVLFLDSCPSSAGLRDAKGRTFLHVAVEKNQGGVVDYACKNRSLEWILNMQDNDGNTALHLAIQAGSLVMFTPLFGNRKVNLNLANAKGQTPRDIAECKVPQWLFYGQNSEALIGDSLRVARAEIGASRQDHIRESYEDIYGLKADYGSKELEKMKDLAQSISIVAVLIATVTFGASFAVPGGLRADDHTNAGTPILAGRYAFDAFMIANTLAFIYSTGAILCLVRAGSPLFDRQSRKIYSVRAFALVNYSVTCLIAAFPLGVFCMLSSVAYNTAIAICVLSPFVMLYHKSSFWKKRLLLAPAYWRRMGPVRTLARYTWIVMKNSFVEYFPFILIFMWASYGRTPPISKVGSLAPSPSI